jgi:hypothetical protein
MSQWTSVLENPDVISHIFGSDKPSLDFIDLHELVFTPDGARIMLRFDLSTYPTSAPKKWIEQDFNRVQIRLGLCAVVDAMVRGCGVKSKLSCRLQEESGVIKLSASNDATTIEISAKFARIEKISGYCEVST